MPKFTDTLKSIKAHLIKKYAWFYGTFLLLIIYMALFQHSFVTSGDIWAEAFPEYVNDALTEGWGEILKSSWAGYLTILPSFLSKLYVFVGLPLGYIDYYLRALTVGFALICLSFIAHPINRKLIPSDISRVAMAFVLLLTLRHVSALAFINIWYVGFIPIILVSLGAVKLSRRWEIVYTVFGVLIALTKSSSILLPFVLYRAIKTKNYITGMAMSLAIVYQTYLTVFAKNGYGSSGVEAQLLDIARDVVLASGVIVFKILHISPPNPLTVLVVSALILCAAVYLLFQYDFWKTTVLGLGLSFAIYLHVFAPDNGFGNLWSQYPALYDDTFKLQREFLINFLLLLLFAIFASRILTKIMLRDRRAKFAAYGALLVAIVLMNPLAKIDTTSPSVTTDISSYRYALNHDQTVCMPVPPTQLWDSQAMWFFQYKGGCYPKVSNRPFEASSFTKNLNDKGIMINIPTTKQDDLRTLTVLIKKSPDSPTGRIALKDMNSGYTFYANVPGNDSSFALTNFNVGGLGPRDHEYKLLLATPESSPPYQIGTFKGTNDPVIYSYFVGYPNIQ